MDNFFLSSKAMKIQHDNDRVVAQRKVLVFESYLPNPDSYGEVVNYKIDQHEICYNFAVDNFLLSYKVLEIKH